MNRNMIQPSIQGIIDSYPMEVDLTNESHLLAIQDSVDQLLTDSITLQSIHEIEDSLINSNQKDNLFIMLCLKLAKSKLLLQSIEEEILLSVVFAVYKEHNRIKPRSQHPHGENFLLKKVEQLNWLLGLHPRIRWEMIIVDDGCPENSGRLAQEVIDKNQLQDKVRVIYLQEAIDRDLPPARGMKATSESQKGGSIVYGMWDALEQNSGDHQIILYTDADLSTHLGQAGLLIDPLIRENKYVAIGSRRERASVVVKKGTRNVRGKLFIYLWKRLIPNLTYIVDTQCGFKAFKAEVVPKIMDDMIERKFAFDIELLLRTELISERSITKVPIAWIDSEEASTTTDLQPYLPMLKSISKMSTQYFAPDPASKEFSELIQKLDDDDFNLLLEQMPPEISRRDPSEFAAFNSVTARDLANILTKEK